MSRFSANALPHLLLQVFPAVFLAILFLQSGLDKVFDWNGNLKWLSGHFAKSPLKHFVPPMLGAITVVEVLAGSTSAAGALQLLITGASTLALVGSVLAATGLTCLFFGQRIAKEYAGAAGLVPYFLLALVTMWIER